MTPRRFTVSSAALRLVAPHVSTDASRPTLSGLLLEADGVMIATNGHTLGAIDAAHNAPESLLLAGDWAKVAKDKGRAASDLGCYAVDELGWVTVTVTGESFVAVNQTTGTAITGRVLSDVYPHWRQCIPADAPEPGKTPAAFAVDPHKLARFAQSRPGKLYGPHGLALHFTGGPERAIRVVRADAPRFVGLIMPCRLSSPAPWGNDWWRTPAPVPAPVSPGVAA